MRKLINKMVQVSKRLIEANLKMEHYWFFPKALVVHEKAHPRQHKGKE